MKEVLRYLNDLSRNNNREWFEANRRRYLDAKATMDSFSLELIAAGLLGRLTDLFRTTKPFLDYINRAVDYVREEAGI